MANLIGEAIASGNSKIHVGDVNNYAQTEKSEIADRKYLQSFRSTDPRDDKFRIESLKGGLLDDVYRWVLKSTEFTEWRDNPERRLLWISGDPGKGKTMLICGIINELGPSTKLKNSESSQLLSYFFCQGTNTDLNNTTRVLQGLIYLLATQQLSLLSYIREKEPDVNHWNSRAALTSILLDMLDDPVSQNSYLIIDALDECSTDLEFLLDIITAERKQCIKWLISSRNQPVITEYMSSIEQGIPLCLELNEMSVSEAVNIYIDFKMKELFKQKKCDTHTQSNVQQYLLSNANGNFLWVALVCQDLKKCRARMLSVRAEQYPIGLNDLYGRMMSDICDLDDAELCKQILAKIISVCRPITLKELVSLHDIPGKETYLTEIIADCGSFLTLRENTIYLVHQSAKDFLLLKNAGGLFPDGIAEEHNRIFQRCLKNMDVLKKDLYGLVHPGIHIDEAHSIQRDHDPLVGIQYSCVYWVDHLLEAGWLNQGDQLQDNGMLHQFFKRRFLFWLEALSLIRQLHSGFVAMVKLRKLMASTELKSSDSIMSLVCEGYRFIQHFRTGIEEHPLQVYTSGLTFSPTKSMIRQTFKDYKPSWIEQKPEVESHWSPLIKVVDVNERILHTAFSSSGQRLAVFTESLRLLIWRPSDDTLQQIDFDFEDELRVLSAAMSSNLALIAAVFSDGTAQVWDIDHNTLKWKLGSQIDQQDLFTLQIDYSNEFVVFSPCDNFLAIIFHSELKIWQIQTGRLHRSCRPHPGYLFMLRAFFSPDGKYLAVFCKNQIPKYAYRETLQVFDIETGGQRHNLVMDNRLNGIPEMSAPVQIAQFLPHADKIAWTTIFSNRLMIWDLSKHPSRLWHTIEKAGAPPSFAFSSCENIIASNNHVGSIILQDTEGNKIGRIRHANNPFTIFFSSDGLLLAAKSPEGIWVWDIAEIKRQESQDSTEISGTQEIYSSSDERCLISISSDDHLKLIWRDTGEELPTQPKQYEGPFWGSFSFSTDAKQLAKGRHLHVLQFWDLNQSSYPRHFTHPFRSNKPASAIFHIGASVRINKVAVSPSGKFVAATIENRRIIIWETKSGSIYRDMNPSECGISRCRFDYVLKFFPSSNRLAVGSYTNCLLIWDVDTREVKTIHLGLLQNRTISSMAISPNEKWVALASYLNLWILNVETGWLHRAYQMEAGRIRFKDNSTLFTSRGIFDFESHPSNILISEGIPSIIDGVLEFRNCGLACDWSWILWNGRKILWIPNEYRAGDNTTILWENTVASSPSCLGRISIIKLSQEVESLLSDIPLQPRHIKPLFHTRWDLEESPVLSEVSADSSTPELDVMSEPPLDYENSNTTSGQ